MNIETGASDRIPPADTNAATVGAPARVSPTSGGKPVVTDTAVDSDFVALNPNRSGTLASGLAGPGAAPAETLDAPDTAAADVPADPASSSQPASSGPVLDAPFVGALQPLDETAVNQGSLLDQVSSDIPINETPPHVSRRRVLGVGLLAFGILAALLLGIRVEVGKSSAQNASLNTPSSQLRQQSLPLTSVSQQLGTAAAVSASNRVTVNGSLILAPSVQPSDPVPGQLYYDQASNQVQYYDGTGFVRLQGGSTASTTINNTYVTNTTVQDITNAASTGPSITGTPGTLAMFGSSGNALADSILADASGAVTDSGDLAVQGNAVFQNTAGSTTAFQINNPAGVSLLSADTANVLIDDSMTASATTGLLSDSATWVPGQYVQLTSGAQYSDGNVTYTPSVGSSFDATFEFWTNGEDEDYFYAYAITPPGQNSNGTDASPIGGYLISYNNTYGQVDLFFNGTLLASAPVSGFGDSSWHAAEIVKDGDTFTISYNGSTVLTYTDIARVLSGTKFGVGASSGAFTGTHRVRDFTMTSGVASGILTIGAYAQFNSDISVAGQASAGSIVTNSEAISPTSNSTNAFQVDNAAGTNELSVDTTNNAIDLGSMNGTPTAMTIQGGAAVGNNLVGANLSIDASDGTGVGGSGNINFYTAGGVSNPLVSVDTTNGAEEADSSATLTWSHTTGSQSDRILIVTVDTAYVSPDTPATVTAVTYNGVGLTELTSLSSADANGSVWYLINPPSGSFPVAVSLTGGPGSVGAEATTFYNVDQTTPITTYTTNQVSGNAISSTLSGTEAGDGIFDALMTRASLGQPILPGSGQTAEYLQNDYANTDTGSFKQGDAGSTTMSWTGAGSADLNQVVLALSPEPNSTADSLTQALSITQSGTLGIDLGSTEDALNTISFGGNADRTIAVDQNPTTGNGHNLTIQAGTGAVGSNNGGSLILQGGAATGTGTGGSVIVKPQTDSTAAFQVDNAAGNSELAVDTVDNTVTLGNTGGTPTAMTIQGGAASGVNAAGADLTIKGSDGTGGANGGDILIQTGQAAEGGIQFDEASQTSILASTALTMSFTVGSQANRILLVGTTNSSVNSITYDGLALTKLGSVLSEEVEGGGAYASLWYLLSPPSGTYPIVATGTNSGNFAVGAMSYYNVEQASPFGTLATATGSVSGTQSTSLSVSTSSTSQVVVDAFAEDVGEGTGITCSTTNSSQNIVWSSFQQYIPTTCGSDQAATGGSVTMTYQATDTDWADVGIPLNPAVPGSTPLESVSGSNSDTMQTRLDITATGNIGIDNSNPTATLDVSGTETVQSTNNSTAAFQVQNSASTALFTADTADMVIDVGGSLIVSGNITVDGHIVTGGSTPSYAAGAAAGCGGTASVNVSGDDIAGTVTVVTGSGACPSSGDLATLTFSSQYASTPHITLTPIGSATEQLGSYVDSPSATGFSIGGTNPPSSAATYSWSYQAMQ